MAPPKAPQRFDSIYRTNHGYLSNGVGPDGESFTSRPITEMRHTWLKPLCTALGIPASNDVDDMRGRIIETVGKCGGVVTFDGNGGPDVTPEPEPVQPEPVQPAPAEPEPAPVAPDKDDPAAAALAALQALMAGAIDADAVRRIVDDRLADMTVPTRTVVVKADRPNVTIEDQTHAAFEPVLRMLTNGLQPMLVGPAGSGKTTLGEQLARALEVPFYAESGAPTPQDHEFKGYRDGNGVYQTTQFRTWAERGGVFLIDEMDRMYPGTLTTLNRALAQREFTFPDGVNVKFADDSYVLAAANTIGLGADAQYTAAQALDASTRNRFVIVPVGYDESLEDQMVRAILPHDWQPVVKRIRRMRKVVKDQGLNVVVSPRNATAVATLIAAEMDADDAWNYGVLTQVDGDAREKLAAA